MDKKMKLEEAIKVLENHNEWRRNNDIPNSIVMVDPKELGIAIDIVVSEFKKLTDKCMKCFAIQNIDTKELMEFRQTEKEAEICLKGWNTHTAHKHKIIKHTMPYYR